MEFPFAAATGLPLAPPLIQDNSDQAHRKGKRSPLPSGTCRMIVRFDGRCAPPLEILDIEG